MESTSPPSFVRNIIATLVESEYIHEVSLRVQPSLLDDRLINKFVYLLAESRARVDEVNRELNNSNLSNNTDAHTNPDRFNADSGEDSPQE